MMMDSLRYWVGEMHVDGFRFDLAPALARDLAETGHFEHFFSMLQQDPLLAEVKLIAEPWDIGPGGYRAGGFPSGWGEWNGRYRDTTRRFWRGDAARTEAGLHCGLGLALVERAAEALQSQLEVRSVDGGEFTVTLSFANPQTPLQVAG